MREKLNGLEDSDKREKREVLTELRRLDSFIHSDNNHNSVGNPY